MARLGDVLKHEWNIFTNQEVRKQTQPYTEYYGGSGGSYTSKPDRTRFLFANGKTIVSAIYTRVAIDVSSVDIRHVRLDDEKRYLEDIDSGLNNCITLESNIDQIPQRLFGEIVLTMLDKGCAAVVPVDTTLNPELTGGYDILTLRVGPVLEWAPRYVKVDLYNEAIGMRQQIWVPKSMVSIVENPLYSVMNEPNSTLQRLLHKLALLDVVDDKAASTKLDLIMQMPYVVKGESRRQQADKRREDIVFQLTNSEYGIAWVDATEKITQLNRPVENNIMSQVEFLTKMLYGQLGLTDTIMDGTADEKTIINYWNRTIEPILTAISVEFKRKFLTKTARTQKQSIMFFRDPFKLAPIEQIAEIADKFTRNEILTSNEFRQIVGRKPHSDPKADQLINSNMPVGDTGVASTDSSTTPVENPGLAEMASSFDEIDSAIDDALSYATSSNGNGP